MSDSTKRITVLTPCFNEAGNVELLYERVRAVFLGLEGYTYEHLFIDNASTDETVAILRRLAARDRNVKVIVNTRNFGHIRSPYHALLQCRGDAVIGMAADLQDPPELIPAFLEKWREGYKVVLGVKSGERGVRADVRDPPSRLPRDRQTVRGEAGSQQHRLRALRSGVRGRAPTTAGSVSLFPRHRRGARASSTRRFPTRQPARTRGVTKNNLYRLYDIGVQGIVNHSRIPLRLATIIGFFSSVLSLLAAFVYFVMKMLFWYNLPIGVAPVIIGLFCVASVQLFFLGVLGEYVGSIYTQVRNRPLVIEEERINFDQVPDA